MLHLKKIPVGIDTTIQALQKKLNNKLITTWGISDELYRCYGRCYRNQSANGYVPEVFISDSVGYKDLFLDDNYAATSFFGVERMDINDDFRGEADVHLVFAVNLKQSKPSIRHRADEEVHQDVIKVFNKNGETKLNNNSSINRYQKELRKAKDIIDKTFDTQLLLDDDGINVQISSI